MKSLVSVIMPAYNRADLVGESINSVISQSYENWELIVTDSASQDGTLEVCRSFAEKDSRIKVFTLDSCVGVSAARNKCLDEAQGDYVFFLDSDDVIHPNLLETLVNAMNSTGAGIGGSACKCLRASVWQEVYEDIKKSSVNETKFLTFDETLEAVFSYTSPINLIGGVMISRELIGDTRFNTELHIGEDYYFMYQNLIKGTDAIFLSSPWYYARIHENNISKDYSFAGFWSRFHRRELVWKTEESEGRNINAAKQKRDAFNVYRSYLMRKNPKTPDGKKIRRTIKTYRKEIMPALNFKDKLIFSVSIAFPQTYHKLMQRKKNK